LDGTVPRTGVAPPPPPECAPFAKEAPTCAGDDASDDEEEEEEEDEVEEEEEEEDEGRMGRERFAGTEGELVCGEVVSGGRELLCPRGEGAMVCRADGLGAGVREASPEAEGDEEEVGKGEEEVGNREGAKVRWGREGRMV
jgi:hypothetical protein